MRIARLLPLLALVSLLPWSARAQTPSAASAVSPDQDDAIYSGTMTCPWRPYAAHGWQIEITVETKNGKGTGSRKTDDSGGSSVFTLNTEGSLVTAEWTGVPPTSAMSAGGTCTVKMRGKQDEGFLSLESVSNTCGAYGIRAALPPGQSDCHLRMRRLQPYK
jgi:hypothetical protein